MATTGLRERKKEATRLALHEAAVRLALAHGLEHITVEAIAEAADVSRRTFSNHFSSTEEAIVYGDAVRLLEVVRRVHEEPEGRPIWALLTKIALDLLPEFLDDRSPDETQRRQLRTHPDLAPYRAAAYSTVERELAAEIARRLSGTDTQLRSRVIAATFLTTVRVAVHHWNANPDRRREDVVAAALAAATPISLSPSQG